MLTEDTLLGGRVKLLQSPCGLRATTDTVFLAAACPADKEAHSSTPLELLDLGCGTGAAGLCVLARATQVHLTGVDIQKDLVDLAALNAALNAMQDTARFICADIREFETDRRFDRIVCNPPYHRPGQHTPSPHRSKAVASGPQHESDAQLKDWLDAAFRLLSPHGILTLIHRADALDGIVRDLGKRFGAIEIIPLWPRAGKPAERIVLRARPNRRTGLILHPGVVMHNENGSYTIDANRILQTPCAL